MYGRSLDNAAVTVAFVVSSYKTESLLCEYNILLPRHHSLSLGSRLPAKASGPTAKVIGSTTVITAYCVLSTAI